ncbi:hypothetical protein MKX08_004607 [Trichoderma sp. CBMAI-0020]|nr:hypothetical protein MKX08_004607 [Trichoderma sp. CBMAI-0020]
MLRLAEVTQQNVENLRPPDVKIEKIRRYMEADMEYTALVYEFINGGENEPLAVEKVADFMYHVGLSFGSSTLAKNWTNSVLVDYADIIHPGGYGWCESMFGMRDAKDVLSDGIWDADDRLLFEGTLEE